MGVLGDKFFRKKNLCINWGGLLIGGFLLLVLSGCPKVISLETAMLAGNSGSREGAVILTLVADNWWQVVPSYCNAPSLNLTATENFSGSMQRTIVSDAYTTATRFYFYATAVSGTGSSFPLTQVTFTPAPSQKTGSVQLPLGFGSWDVEVYVCLTDGLQDIDAVRNDAVLKGSAHVDTMNASTVFFTLSPKGLTRNGVVSLTLNPSAELQSLPGGFTVTAAIKDLATGSVILDSASATTEKNINNFPAQRGNYQVNSLPPGTYLFQLTMTSNTTSISHVWSDVLIVLPGKTVSKTLEIPNFVGSVPAAPTGVTAALVTNSENAGLGNFEVKLEWTDASNNESHFELQVAELLQQNSINAYPTNENTWTNLMTSGTAPKTYGRDFFGSNLRSSGSLNAGNSTVTLNLRLGSRYVVRLRAVGGAGSSAWVYPTLGQASTGTTAITSTTINRFAVTYDLAGGTYTPATGQPTTNNQVQYYFQENTGVQLLAPTAPNGANSLVRDNGQWSGWQNSSTGTNYPTGITPSRYTDFKNLGLLAQYTVKPVNLGFSVITHNAVEMQLGWITVGGSAINNNMVSVSKTASQSLDFIVSIPNTSYPFNEHGFAYESIDLQIKNNKGITVFSVNSNGKVLAGASKTFTLPNLADRVSGNYICTISAKYTSSIEVTQQFILVITN